VIAVSLSRSRPSDLFPPPSLSLSFTNEMPLSGYPPLSLSLSHTRGSWHLRCQGLSRSFFIKRLLLISRKHLGVCFATVDTRSSRRILIQCLCHPVYFSFAGNLLIFVSCILSVLACRLHFLAFAFFCYSTSRYVIVLAVTAEFVYLLPCCRSTQTGDKRYRTNGVENAAF